MVSIAPPDKDPGSDRETVEKDGLTLIEGRRNTVEISKSENSFKRAGKSIWAGIKRVNKRVGEAEARLILRVFYYTVFGVVSLVRRKSTDDSGEAEVTWSARTSPTTDPTKQY